jgi:hypothetical protein
VHKFERQSHFMNHLYQARLTRAGRELATIKNNASCGIA